LGLKALPMGIQGRQVNHPGAVAQAAHVPHALVVVNII